MFGVSCDCGLDFVKAWTLQGPGWTGVGTTLGFCINMLVSCVRGILYLSILELSSLIFVFPQNGMHIISLRGPADVHKMA